MKFRNQESGIRSQESGEKTSIFTCPLLRMGCIQVLFDAGDNCFRVFETLPRGLLIDPGIEIVIAGLTLIEHPFYHLCEGRRECAGLHKFPVERANYLRMGGKRESFGKERLIRSGNRVVELPAIQHYSRGFHLVSRFGEHPPD
jgi:hypothetical protein